ncbi:MAG: ABC transporter substrate-binding protein [Deltaproteobacteria bacterium]|nr:ABC transporter substrate-binding protein [Deltaproteobacteria bacterium]MBI3078168.1 ABC transporter substrate-binding protein [Deltaproteobacteria bacterium]
MRNRIVTFGVALAAGLLLAVTSSTPAAAEAVALRLNWTVNGGNCTWFLGLDRGYFKDQGLDLTIKEGSGSATGVKLIASGDTTFAYVDYTSTAVAISRGMPIKAVFGVERQGPLGVMTLKEWGVERPQDLVGKKIGTSTRGSGGQLFAAFLRRNDVPPDKVKLVGYGGGERVIAMLEKQVHGFVGFFTTDAVGVIAKGVPLNILKFTEWGMNIMGPGVVVNTETIAKQPQLIRRFITGARRTWAEARTHPEEAVAATIRRFPKENASVLLLQLKLMLGNIDSPHSAGRPIGWMAREDWDEMQRTFVEVKEIRRAIPVEQYYTNEFLPQ